MNFCRKASERLWAGSVEMISTLFLQRHGAEGRALSAHNPGSLRRWADPDGGLRTLRLAHGLDLSHDRRTERSGARAMRGGWSGHEQRDTGADSHVRRPRGPAPVLGELNCERARRGCLPHPTLAAHEDPLQALLVNDVLQARLHGRACPVRHRALQRPRGVPTGRSGPGGREMPPGDVSRAQQQAHQTAGWKGGREQRRMSCSAGNASAPPDATRPERYNAA